MNKFSENIGIVGQGFVGTAVKEKFKDYYNVYTYDKYSGEKSRVFAMDQVSENEIDLATLVKQCETVFVCVPTPMFPNGQCDTSIVDEVILRISNISTELDRRTAIIIKSTIPPGTTRSLDLEYDNVTISFSPEFLTEANSIEDFKNQNRIILGIDWIEYIEPLTAIFRKVFPEAEIAVMRSDEAEMSKYMINLFLATKVSFFNDMYKVIEKMNNNSSSINMSFEAIVGAALMDPRIGKSHYMVPGPDGDYGYGGHCFPGTHTVETPHGKITLEDAYKKFNSGDLLECLSFDHTLGHLEIKIINEVTKNYYEGDLLIFELENGESFKCTPEHLFPINRNGKMILVQAKDILESDDFYSASEYIN